MLKNKTKFINRIKKDKAKNPSNLFSGKYSNKLTKRTPRKKLKDPRKVFKDKILLEKIFRDIKPYSFKDSRYRSSLNEFSHAVKTHFNKDIFKTKGEHLHVFLPQTGMGSVGWFYKGFLEQVLPKARVTFLVTPSTTNITTTGLKKVKYGTKYKKFLKSGIDHKASNSYSNLKKHLEKCLNKSDKYFVMFDYYFIGRTYSIIDSALKELYGREQKFLQVHSNEHRRSSSLKVAVKDYEGNYAIPTSESFKKNNLTRASHFTFKSKTNKETYRQLKNKEKLIKSTYYYLGNKLANNEEIVRNIKNA